MTLPNLFKVQASKTPTLNIAFIFALYEIGMKAKDIDTPEEFIELSEVGNVFAYEVIDKEIYTFSIGTETDYYKCEDIPEINIREFNLNSKSFNDFIDLNKTRISDKIDTLRNLLEKQNPLLTKKEMESKIDTLISMLS